MNCKWMVLAVELAMFLEAVRNDLSSFRAYTLVRVLVEAYAERCFCLETPGRPFRTSHREIYEYDTV